MEKKNRNRIMKRRKSNDFDKAFDYNKQWILYSKRKKTNFKEYVATLKNHIAMEKVWQKLYNMESNYRQLTYN